MKKLIALALSTAVIALPTAANADGRHHHDGDRYNHSYNYGGHNYHNTTAIPIRVIPTAMLIRAREP